MDWRGLKTLINTNTNYARSKLTLFYQVGSESRIHSTVQRDDEVIIKSILADWHKDAMHCHLYHAVD